ncbi:hypothetical protein M8312_11380 [Sphingomonas sp. KRR8]|uniref:hypothetical protein n=1 Tax=Sphingomonas sp. KRR8 TaxID=2942996 RepID=UPI00202190D7|nr:hypothetical protein [Sphingomonas sp. KRR8]URD60378.1 hypothetical protein M8312_11380 [Sphingomonas sp. KRR8]
MKLSIPKPIHGWREFAGEVGIIVLGVLIALGAQQPVEWGNHLSQVDEMSARLRRESLENRDGMNFDLASLRKSLNAVNNQLGTLDGCKSPLGVTRLASVQRPLVLLATDSAWLGVRDSALLPMMPKDVVDNYWKLDATGQQLLPILHDAQLSFNDAEASVSALKANVADAQSCVRAVQSLYRLRSAEQSLVNWVSFYQSANEQVLRGERLVPPRIRAEN